MGAVTPDERAELDAWVLEELAQEPSTFQRLYLRRERTDSLAYRKVDASLQRLRKAGKIETVRPAGMRQHWRLKDGGAT